MTDGESMDMEIEGACTECTKKPGEISRLKKSICSDCWIYHCNFRFRKRLYELGKPQKMLAGAGAGNPVKEIGATTDISPCSSRSQGVGSSSHPFIVENVLLDYDGSSDYSMVLLYLIRDSIIASLEKQDVERPKTLPFPFTFTILFISAGVHENGEIDLTKKANARMKNFEKLTTWYKDMKNSSIGSYFPSIIVTSLEESLAIQNVGSNITLLDLTEQIDMKPQFPLNGPLHEKLVELVEDLKTKTTRIDLLQILRQNLIKAVAQRLHLSKVLVSEDQTNLATKMFSLMSLGRGAQLADQMNFVTRDESGLLIARPLMDLSSDDLRDYLRCLNLIEKRRSEKADAKNIDNIEAQCEDFIMSLQKDFTSTVPTLTRIGAKLEPTCKHSISNNDNDIEFQKKQTCVLCKNIQDDVTNDEMKLRLCYGCTKIVKEMKTPNLLLDLLSHR